MRVDPFPCKMLHIPLHRRACTNVIVELRVVASANDCNNLFVSLLNSP